MAGFISMLQRQRFAYGNEMECIILCVTLEISIIDAMVMPTSFKEAVIIRVSKPDGS